MNKSIERLDELMSIAKSAKVVIKNTHYIKANRVHSLTKKSVELMNHFNKTIKEIGKEIEHTKQQNRDEIRKNGSV